jgi:serine/threonine-protein kinase RsbW
MPVPQQLAEVVRTHAWSFTVRPHDIRQWRRTVAAALNGWGASADSVDHACLGVTELLTNVAKHVPDDPRCYLKVQRMDADAIIGVCDRSTQPAVITEPDWNRESGRGLWLLREVLGSVGYEPLPDWPGKRVWFRCELRGRNPLPACDRSPPRRT